MALAHLLFIAGQYVESLEAAKRASINPDEVIALQPILAWAYLEVGDEMRAELFVRKGFGRAAEEGFRMDLVDVLRVAAMLHTRCGCWDDARGSLEEALALARTMRYPYAEARALYAYGDMLRQKGEPEQARERFEAALPIFRRLGARPYIELTEQVVAELKKGASH